jgi:hypothetical protein
MVVADDSGLVFALVLASRQMAGDKANAGSGAVTSFRKLLVRSGWENENLPSEMTRGVLGLTAVEVGLKDTGGSGKGHEGGGEIGGNDFLDIIRGGGVYI